MVGGVRLQTRHGLTHPDRNRPVTRRSERRLRTIGTREVRASRAIYRRRDRARSRSSKRLRASAPYLCGSAIDWSAEELSVWLTTPGQGAMRLK